MQRRHLLLAAAALPARSAFAHHGWSSFDTGRPLYLSGRARKVAWRNPHAEFDLELDADLKLPADLAKRPVPAQSAGIDGARLFASFARIPERGLAAGEREMHVRARQTDIGQDALVGMEQKVELGTMAAGFGDPRHSATQAAQAAPGSDPKIASEVRIEFGARQGDGRDGQHGRLLKVSPIPPLPSRYGTRRD